MFLLPRLGAYTQNGAEVTTGSVSTRNVRESMSARNPFPIPGYVVFTIYGRSTPFTCVPAMERANDVTRSFLDFRLLPALPVAWLPPWQRHSPQVSWQPIQISVFLAFASSDRELMRPFLAIQIEAARPIYGYVQSPDFTPATSSPPSHFITLPASIQVYNSRDESYIKAPTATSKRREATSRSAWEFFISKLPACRHYIIKCSSSFTLF